MNKNISPSHLTWQGRTGNSLIVGLMNHKHPMSPSNSPRLKLNDLYNQQKTLKKQKSEQYFAKYVPNAAQFKRPQHFQLENQRDQFKGSEDKQLYFRKAQKLKLSQQLKQGSNWLKPPILRNTGSSQQGRKLSNSKSDKALPKFLRNMGKRQLRFENFKVLKTLGQGKFGSVSLAVQLKTGVVVALKKMQKQRIIKGNMLHQFIRQLKIQSFMDHPNILKIYGYFVDKQYFYTVMELGCDGQLYDIISAGTKLSEESTSFIIGNLLQAVDLMHKHKVLHRDIKPENIVLVHGNVKLCDFGWAVNKKQELRSTFCGTPLYLSPELMTGQKYDEKVDLWAVGVLAYELHLGTTPFDIQDQQDLVRIVTQEVKFPSSVSQKFKQFINQILKKNPKERLSCDKLLSLPFISNYRDMETCNQLCH